MSNLVDFSSLKQRQEELKKKVILVEFKKRNNTELDNEMYIEHSSGTNNNLKLMVQNNRLLTGPVNLEEDAYAGGYNITINGKNMFLDFAESLDLYVLLNSLFSKTDGIKSVTTLLEE
jgi:hypothetical protein